MHRRDRTVPIRTHVVVLTLPLLFLLERPVQGYIDPGSGSLVYQAVLAVVLGLGFTFRRVLGAVRRFGRRSPAPPPAVPPTRSHE